MSRNHSVVSSSSFFLRPGAQTVSHMLVNPAFGGPAPGPVRTLADMTEEEVRALERHYGVPVRRPEGPRVMVRIGQVIVSTTRAEAARMIKRRQRDRRFGTKLDRRCRCGHPLGDHFAWAPYACDLCASTAHPCEAFVPHVAPAGACEITAPRRADHATKAAPRAARERKRRT